MKELLLGDLKQVLSIYAVFATAYGANVIFSLYKNIGIAQEGFSFKKLFKGVLQAIVLILGTLLLVIAIDLLLILVGANNTNLGELITVASVLLTIGIATAKYIKEAYTTLQDILNNTK